MEFKNHQILCVGEMLWDRLPSGSKPGGAHMNVAIHLKAAGQIVFIAGRVGKDKAGQDLKKFIKKAGLELDLIQEDELLPTSEVIVELDQERNAKFIIKEPVAWDNIEFTDKLAEKAGESGVLIYGSLASRGKKSRDTILKLLDSDAVKLIDVNFRKPYDTKDIIEPLLKRSDIVKLNDDELRIIAGWHGKGSFEEKDLADWFANRYNVRMVCVTKGARGALLYSEGEIYEHNGFKVNVVDTVGAGDAFLAGFLISLFEKKSLADTLSFACATGAFVAENEGATPVFNIDRIIQIMS